MRRLLFAIVAAAISGCAASTGPLPAGPNTYVLTAPASPVLGGADRAERDGLQQAEAFCRSQGREMLPSETHQEHGLTTEQMTGFTVQFRCLLPSDPEFHR
jgi:hypothetical protein